MRTALLALALSLCAQAQDIRFEPYAGELAYGLAVVPPWPGGGRLVVNFPEHLEAGDDGNVSILRYYEKEPRERWRVAPDGLSASLELESPRTPGVWIGAKGKVVGRDRIEFTFAIANKSAHPLVKVNPLYCHHYAELTGFPQRVADTQARFDNFDHIYTLIGGKVVKVSGIGVPKPASHVRGANVAGSTQPESDFIARRGGRLDSPIDAAVSAVTSLDGRRKLILAWTPGSRFLSNAEIPCLHADPFYGTIEPGKSAEAHGIVILTEGPLEPAMLQLTPASSSAAPTR